MEEKKKSSRSRLRLFPSFSVKTGVFNKQVEEHEDDGNVSGDDVGDGDDDNVDDGEEEEDGDTLPNTNNLPG